MFWKLGKIADKMFCTQRPPVQDCTENQTSDNRIRWMRAKYCPFMPQMYLSNRVSIARTTTSDWHRECSTLDQDLTNLLTTAKPICHVAPTYPLKMATSEMMTLPIRMAITDCQTERPVLTREPPICQFVRQIWLMAQKEMKAHRVQVRR